MKLSMERTIRLGETWTCPTCNDAVSTSYCPACGECPLSAHELSLRGLLNQCAQACTNIDGPLIRSFRCLVARLGLLTLEPGGDPARLASPCGGGFNPSDEVT